MPIHYNINIFNLLEEVRRLEEAGMIVRFIVPELIEHKENNKYGLITDYIIIFDEP